MESKEVNLGGREEGGMAVEGETGPAGKEEGVLEMKVEEGVEEET